MNSEKSSLQEKALENKIQSLKHDIETLDKLVELGSLSRAKTSTLYLRQILGYWERIQDGQNDPLGINHHQDESDLLHSLQQCKAELAAYEEFNQKAFEISASSPDEYNSRISETTLQLLKDRISRLEGQLGRNG